jgi:hypothetical protein
MTHSWLDHDSHRRECLVVLQLGNGTRAPDVVRVVPAWRVVDGVAVVVAVAGAASGTEGGFGFAEAGLVRHAGSIAADEQPGTEIDGNRVDSRPTPSACSTRP